MYLYKPGHWKLHQAIVASDGKKDILIDYTSPNGSKIVDFASSCSWVVRPIATLAIQECYATTFMSKLAVKLLYDYGLIPAIQDRTNSLIENRTKAKLIIEEFTGDKSQCELKGETKQTLDELKDTATKISLNNPCCTTQYDSQTFCKEVIQKTTSNTHKTDTVTEAGMSVLKIALVGVGATGKGIYNGITTFGTTDYSRLSEKEKIRRIKAWQWPQNSLARVFL